MNILILTAQNWNASSAEPHLVNFSFNPIVLLSCEAVITSCVKESNTTNSAAVAPVFDHKCP
jgi:hypothetical protein